MTFQPTSPTPGTAAEPPIANDGWWPNIDLAKLRAACRLDGTVTTDKLRTAAIGAVLHVNDQLAAWVQAQKDAGFAALADVPGPSLDGQPRTVLCYLRAVYAGTQCELLERYRDYDASAKGDKQAEAMAPRIDETRRDMRWAINDLQGKPRSTVELI